MHDEFSHESITRIRSPREAFLGLAEIPYNVQSESECHRLQETDVFFSFPYQIQLSPQAKSVIT